MPSVWVWGKTHVRTYKLADRASSKKDSGKKDLNPCHLTKVPFAIPLSRRSQTCWICRPAFLTQNFGPWREVIPLKNLIRTKAGHKNSLQHTFKRRRKNFSLQNISFYFSHLPSSFMLSQMTVILHLDSSNKKKWNFSWTLKTILLCCQLLRWEGKAEKSKLFILSRGRISPVFEQGPSPWTLDSFKSTFQVRLMNET